MTGIHVDVTFRRDDETDSRRDDRDEAILGRMAPEADVIEYPQAYEILVDLPGLVAQDMTVAVEGDAVTVAGLRPDPETTHCDALARPLAERRYGVFRRVFPLPADADRHATQASLADGVLAIVVPKAAAASR